MILVAGATGHLGQEVINQLLRLGAKDKFAILARNEEKAKHLADKGIEIRVADFDYPESLPAAFAGIEKFLFISTMAMNRTEQQRSVVDAAVAENVKHIVYTGLAIKDIETSGVRDLMISHFQTEDHIKDSGVHYTFLRNTMYAEAISTIIGPQALTAGIFLPGGSGKVPYALRAEMGEAAANVLLQQGHENKIYNITGNTAYSYADIARQLSALTGNNLNYQPVSSDDLHKVLQQNGMPEFLIYLTLGTLQDIRTGQYDIESRDLERLLARPPQAIAGMLQQVFSKAY